MTEMYCIVLIVGVIQLPESTDRRSAADLYMCLPAIFSAKLARQEQARVCIELFNDTLHTRGVQEFWTERKTNTKSKVAHCVRCGSSSWVYLTGFNVLHNILVLLHHFGVYLL